MAHQPRRSYTGKQLCYQLKRVFMRAMTEPVLLAQVIAHRGASGDAPENTAAAISLAADQGASFIEIDVSISSDHIPFVHHDDSLERCTTGVGLLCEQTGEQLDQLDASKQMPGFAGEPLPRLTAIIDVLDARGLGLNLEIKPRRGLEAETVEAICSVIETRWPSRLPLVFSSFNRSALATAQRRLPAVARGLLVEAIPDDWSTLVGQYQCRNVHCDGSLITHTQAQQLIHAGLGVYCYTVNESHHAQTLINLGVHGIFTDFPQRLLNDLGT